MINKEDMERHGKMNDEEWKKHMAESQEKYWILRRNSPRLDAELREAHREREEASEDYGYVKKRLWEEHKRYKRATDPYWCEGAFDHQFQEVLANNPNADVITGYID